LRGFVNRFEIGLANVLSKAGMAADSPSQGFHPKFQAIKRERLCPVFV
jgi:hypothetical protein